MHFFTGRWPLKAHLGLSKAVAIGRNRTKP